MGNYSFKWCLKKPKPTKRTQKPLTVFHEQVCFLSFCPVTWWKLWFGFLFLTEMLVFDTLLLYKLTKAAHCNEVMESQGMKMKHGISYFSIVISPCFQGISGAVLLGGRGVICLLSSSSIQLPTLMPRLWFVSLCFSSLCDGKCFLLALFCSCPRYLILQHEFFSFSHSLSHNLKYDVVIKGVLDSNSDLASISA